MCKKFGLLLIAVFVSAALPAMADANYVFTSFDGPNSGAGTTVNGINNLDQIVGFSVDNNDVVTNWIRNTNGTFSILNLPPSGAFANGINSTPIVVGQNGTNAFVYEGGMLLNFPLATTAMSQIAFGINDMNAIVGQYTENGVSPGFVYDHGTFTTLSPVNNALTVNAQGINNPGLVAGFFSTDGVTSHGFFYNTLSKSYQMVADPNVPNFVFSQILGINDNGIAVGYYGTTNGSQHGFLYDIATQTYTFLDDPDQGIINGVSITQITGISNDGEITGFYVGIDGIQHGFYAIEAVPEPASLLLLGSGVIGLAGVLRRKAGV